MSHFLAGIMVDTVIEANRQLAKSGFVAPFDFSEEAKQVVYENFRKPVDNMILGGGDVVIDVPIFLLGLLEGFAIFNREVVDGLHDDVVLPEKLSKYLESNSLKPPITSFVEDYVKDKWSSLFPTNKDDSEAMLWRSRTTTTLDCTILGLAAASIFKKGMKLLGKIKRPSSAVGSSLASEAAIAEEATLAKKVNNAAKSTLAEADTLPKSGKPKKDLSKVKITKLAKKEEVVDNINKVHQKRLYNAKSVNAQESINKKMSALEKAKKTAVKIEELPDGRIRYYTEEKLATNPGPTRGASYVTEYNKKTGQVRSWMECYDNSGNVNRIHPKMIDGNKVTSQHYPSIKEEFSNK